MTARAEGVADGRKPRRCLMHGGEFLSDGYGNRICRACKASSEYTADAEEYAAANGVFVDAVAVTEIVI